MARLEALNHDDLPPEYRALFDEFEATRGFVPVLYRVMANAPAAMASFVRFTSELRDAEDLARAEKELAILLVGHLTGAATIVTAHRGFAIAAGVSVEKIDALPGWQSDPAFNARERAMLTYAEAVTRDIRVDDAVWNDVRRRFSDAELAALTLTIACYNLVARFLEPLEIELDPGYGTPG